MGGETAEFWSLIPPVIAIGLALITRQVFLALGVGIWLGYIALAGGNPLVGTLDTINGFIAVLTDTGNARLIAFTLLIGALIALVQRSGGVEGFIARILDFLTRVGTRQADKGNRKVVELIAMLTGLVLFIESNISILTVGTLYRPIFDRLGIPREKLGYIADSTCAPSCILMPFNAWGAYVMGLLLAAGYSTPLPVFLKSTLFNFYPFLAILLLLIVILSGRDWGEMKKAEARARDHGLLLRKGATPMMDDSISMMEAKQDVPLRAFNMMLPIAAMVVLMPLFLVYTGWEGAQGKGWFAALAKGSGSASVLYAVCGAILVAMLLYRLQGILRIREMVDLSLTGMAGMVSLALLIVLAFALNALCRELGTGPYLASIAGGFITPALVPAIIFVLAALMAFSTGTSWGTFAVMIALAVPLANDLGANPHMAIAAALGGGIFGDHCSPTSDTTLIASMATANDHIDHVRTQLPYALIAGGATFLLYLILGLVGV